MNKHRGFIVPLVALILVLVAGASLYLYTKQQIVSTPSPIVATTTESNSQAITKNNEPYKNKILPVSFVSSGTDTILVPLFGKRTPVEYPSIKYYDDSVLIIQYPSVKGCAVLWLYNRYANTHITNAFADQDGCGQLLETPDKLFVVSDKKIVMWKIGNAVPVIIDGSTLSGSETYDQGLGMGAQENATLTGTTLVVPVYKQDQSQEEFVQLRTAKFDLTNTTNIPSSTQSQPATTGLKGVVFPSTCRVVDSSDPSRWLVDCGSTNDARGTINTILMQQGWQYCGHNLATQTWVKTRVLVSTTERSNSGDPIALTQQTVDNPQCDFNI
jgi:hypothetical protein